MSPRNDARAHAGSPADGLVRIIEWPAMGDELEALATTRTPRLLLVADGAEPPMSSDCCQDWMWRTGDEQEIRLRLRQLSLRALAHRQGRPHLDSLGLLHVGLRSVHLAPKEQALASVLLDKFNDVVSAESLIQAVWPSGISKGNVLACRISSLRSRLACVGLEIWGTRSGGYSMRVQNSVAAENVGGFEDEIEAARLLDPSRAAHARGRVGNR